MLESSGHLKALFVESPQLLFGYEPRLATIKVGRPNKLLKSWIQTKTKPCFRTTYRKNDLRLYNLSKVYTLMEINGLQWSHPYNTSSRSLIAYGPHHTGLTFQWPPLFPCVVSRQIMLKYTVRFAIIGLQ